MGTVQYRTLNFGTVSYRTFGFVTPLGLLLWTLGEDPVLAFQRARFVAFVTLGSLMNRGSPP